MKLTSVSGKWTTEIIWYCACRKFTFSDEDAMIYEEQSCCTRCYSGPITRVITHTRRAS